jgi:hypothetical protein
VPDLYDTGELEFACADVLPRGNTDARQLDAPPALAPGVALVIDVGYAPGCLLLRSIATLALAMAGPSALSSWPSRVNLRSPLCPASVRADDTSPESGLGFFPWTSRAMILARFSSKSI